MNLVILAALRSSLVNALTEDCDENCILTEFSKQELEEINDFFLTGKYSNAELKSSLTALGIDLAKLTNHLPDQSCNQDESSFKVEIKEELINDFIYDEYLEDMPLVELASPKKNQRRRGRPPKSSDENRIPQRLIKEKKSNECQKLFDTYELPKPIEEFKMPSFESRIKHTSRVIDYTKELSCETCGARFSAKQNLLDHVTKYHYEHYDCLFCKRSFKIEDLDKFKYHMFKHEHNLLNTTSSTCVQCGKFFRFSSHYREHMKARGPYHNDECAQCSKKLPSYDEYRIHVELEHNGSWKFKCGHCKNCFDSEVALKSHVSFTHKVARERGENVKKKSAIKDKVCEECGKNVRDLKGHVDMVHRNYKVPCTLCGHFAKNKYALKRHMEWFHEEIPCDICGVMIGKRKMTEHVSSKHTSIYDRKFKCEQCGKGFSDNAKLNEHRNVHTGEKPFKCKFCHTSFASRGTKAMHERGHLGHKRK